MNSLLGHKSSTQSSAVIKVDPSMAMLLAELFLSTLTETILHSEEFWLFSVNK